MTDLLVGSYSPDMGGSAAGIALLGSLSDGTLRNDGYVLDAESPSYLLRKGDTLYAACEGTGRIEAFDLVSGSHLGGADAGGTLPCHLSFIDGALLVSCYGDGAIGVLSTDPLQLTDVVTAVGSGPRVEQDAAHAHSTLAFGDLVLSADLGGDRLHVHTLRDGVLTRERSVELPPGSCPRDLVRHPSGRLVVLCELSNELMLFTPELEHLATAPLPGAVEGDHAAGISLSADGRFVFVAVRGSDLIATLAIEGDRLTGLGAVDCAGIFPRHHVVVGEVLHVANQVSSGVASFAIGSDGGLRLLAEPTPAASPTFLLAVDLSDRETLLK